ncbi:T9SS type A sorting domain-containing protein [bacterium]|nr:T9SS type A sorting domain-containing protein [bacterium]MBU1983079.1 T9SS type A sorting domain-containing protein [bacterium]
MVWDSERVIVTGTSYSDDFPLTPAAYDTSLTGGSDAFVSIVHLPGTLEYSTLLGGSGADEAKGVAVANNSIVVLGNLTTSYDFPVTPGAYDTLINNDGQPSQTSDLFLVRMDRSLSTVLYGTFFGGWGNDEGNTAYFVHPDTVWFGGRTSSGDLPTTPNAIQPLPGGIGDGWFACFALPPVDTTFVTTSPFLPSEFTFSVYPNPFNPTATLLFTLSQSSVVDLHIYNLLGQEVYAAGLGRLSAGEHRHVFDASDLPSGVYFAGLSAGGMTKTRKLIVLK